jgi:CPA1 family monovalent cation:H+ antiporter
MEHLGLIAAFAIVGVVISTATLGLMMWWTGAIDSLLVALLFGSLLAATDPVSVLALFKELHVPDDLKTIVEGESLFNDGTAVVVFSILLAMISGTNTHGAGAAGHGATAAAAAESFSAVGALLTFLKVSVGGFVLGGVLGWVVYQVLKRLNDHLLENAICFVLAYGSFWVGEVVHVSGVIATVVAGLLIGNFGKRFGMSEETRETVDTFFSSIDFLINSVLFILIGLELQTLEAGAIGANVWAMAVAIVAMLVSRALAVYPIYAMTGGMASGRPFAWSHVLWWGGLRGSIPIALLVSLNTFEALAPYRATLLVAGFGAVFFSLVVQGITIKPLLRLLGLGGGAPSAAGEAAAAKAH